MVFVHCASSEVERNTNLYFRSEKLPCDVCVCGKGRHKAWEQWAVKTEETKLLSEDDECTVTEYWNCLSTTRALISSYAQKLLREIYTPTLIKLTTSASDLKSIIGEVLWRNLDSDVVFWIIYWFLNGIFFRWNSIPANVFNDWRRASKDWLISPRAVCVCVYIVTGFSLSEAAQT